MIGIGNNIVSSFVTEALVKRPEGLESGPMAAQLATKVAMLEALSRVLPAHMWRTFQLLCGGTFTASLLKINIPGHLSPILAVVKPMAALTLVSPLLSRLCPWLPRKKRRLLNRQMTTAQRRGIVRVVSLHTAEENAAVRSLGAALAAEHITVPPWMEGGDLLRYLRVSNMDVRVAARRVCSHLAWRSGHTFMTAAELASWSKLVYWHREGLGGEPVLVIKVGEALAAFKARRLHHARFLEAIVSQTEYAVACLFEEDTREQMVVIMDCSGVGITNAPLGLVKGISRTLAQNYPLRLKRMLLTDASPTLNLVVSAVKAWLHPITQQKIVVAGRSEHQRLLEHVAEECLPRLYGGACDCARCVFECPEGPRHGGTTPAEGSLLGSSHGTGDVEGVHLPEQGHRERHRSSGGSSFLQGILPSRHLSLRGVVFSVALVMLVMLAFTASLRQRLIRALGEMGARRRLTPI